MNSGSKALPFVRNNLDSILALIGAIFSIVLIAYLQINVGQPTYTAAAVLAFLACVAYLVLKWRRWDDIHPCLLTKNFGEYSDQMLLIREEIVNHPFGTGSGCYYKLNYDPRQFLSEQGFNKVYDCGSVSGFIR